MRSLEAIFRNYDLNPVIRSMVDSGLYSLTRDLVIGNSDSGVRIVGPVDRSAIIERVGTGSSSDYVARLENADNLTFENLTIRGNGANGIAALTSPGSDNLPSAIAFSPPIVTGLRVDYSGNFTSVIDSDFDGGPLRNQTSHCCSHRHWERSFKVICLEIESGQAVAIASAGGLVENNEIC